MGVQVTCPLCGFNRAPERYTAREIVAKDVRALGGNEGFEHVEIEPPENVQRRIEIAIAALYHAHVTVDPFLARDRLENRVRYEQEPKQKVTFSGVKTNVRTN